MKVKITGDSAQSIAESVRELTKQGVLNTGDSLPSVRQLAEDLGVNRNTVSAAYQRLAKAGIAITQGRLGTRICHDQKAGEQEGVNHGPLFDLADGSPRLTWLPDLNQVAQATTLNQYVYGEATILPSLHDYIQQWFRQDCDREFALTLCNGAIDSLERLMSAHLIPGDTVAVEDPCYISSANAIRLAGLQVMGIEIDEQGMRPDALADALANGAKAVLVTPRAHNPTGVCLSSERAKQLRDILSGYPNVLVMEDDHFSLIATRPYHSIIPDNCEHWALFRSVSKGFGPDLRMAFVAADHTTVNRINTRLAPGMSWVSRVLQSMVMTCLTTPEFQHQREAAIESCTHARNLLIAALNQYGFNLSDQIEGLNVWVPVKQDCQAAAYALSRKGWLVRPGQAFDIHQKSQAVRVSIQKINEEIAQRFAKDVSTIIDF